MDDGRPGLLEGPSLVQLLLIVKRQNSNDRNKDIHSNNSNSGNNSNNSTNSKNSNNSNNSNTSQHKDNRNSSPGVASCMPMLEPRPQSLQNRLSFAAIITMNIINTITIIITIITNPKP